MAVLAHHYAHEKFSGSDLPPVQSKDFNGAITLGKQSNPIQIS